MRRILAIVALSLAALSSCGATLSMRASAPTMDNDGTCSAPLLFAAPAGVLRVVHFAWAGPVSGEDSVIVVVGSLATLSVNVRPGTYTVRGWASGAGVPGCDTTVTRTVSAPPGRIVFQ